MNQRTQLLNKRVIVTVFMVILLIIALVAAGAAIARREDPIDRAFQAAQSAISYPLYRPRHLPSGYQYKAGSISENRGVVVFALTGPSGEALAVTEQAKPRGFDFSQLSGTDEFETSLGSAYVEDFNNRTTGSIVGDQTWIIINTYSPIGADAMRTIINAFQ